jgi:SAM-dependent methyltransferase
VAPKYTHNILPLGNTPFLSEVNICDCGDCGMWFAADIPSKEDLDAYYQTMSKYEDTATPAKWSGRYEIIGNYIAKYIAGKSKRIVDLGCGHGNQLAYLKHLGYTNLCGVELSAKNCRLLNGIGIQSVAKAIENVSVTDLPSKGDYIIIDGVLEHSANPGLQVKKIRELLSDSGGVFACVPDARMFGTTARYPFAEFSVEHINFFTVETLSLLFQRYGFRLVDVLEDYAGIQTFVAYFERSKTENVGDYVAASENAIIHANEIIERFAQSGEPIVLYGAGSFAQHLAANTRLMSCNIKAVADGNSNYRGVHFGKFPITDPQSINQSAINQCTHCELLLVI